MPNISAFMARKLTRQPGLVPQTDQREIDAYNRLLWSERRARALDP
jgi:hypothetical protein